MRETTLGTVLIVLLVVGSVTAQETLCAGKYRTTAIGGSDGARTMAAVENLLVTVDEDALTTWDISDPADPRRLGQWISIGDTERMYEASDRIAVDPRGFAYVDVVDHSYSSVALLEVFDLRDPTRPRPINTLDRWWDDFVLHDHLLIGADDTLDILDVSDPFHPVPLCEDCFDFEARYDGFGTAVAMSGDLLVAFRRPWDFVVFDLSDPTDPVMIHEGVVRGDERIWATDALVVVSGMRVIDLSNPTEPVVHDYGYHPSPRWVEFRGTTAIVDARDRIVVLDLENPALPVELESVPFDAHSAARIGDRLVIGDGEGIHVADIDQIASSIEEGKRWDHATSVAVEGDLAFVSGHSDLRLFDLANPSGPVELARLDLPAPTGRAAVEDDLVAVPMEEGQFGVVTIEADQSMVLRSLIRTGTCRAAAADFDKERLFVGLDCPASSGRMEIYDLADPREPRLLGSLQTHPSIHGVTVDGDFVYAVGGDTVMVIDASDTANPFLRSAVEVDHCYGDLNAIAKTGGCLVVGSSRPTSPNCSQMFSVDVWSPDLPLVQWQKWIEVGWLTAAEGVVVGGNRSDLIMATFSTYCQEVSIQRYAFPRTATSGGGLRDGRVYLATRHWIDDLDLSCEPAELDFTWRLMGTTVQFSDRTTYPRSHMGDGSPREWFWRFGEGEYRRYTRVPDVEFGLPGRYHVEMQIRRGSGRESVTKTVDVPREQSLATEMRVGEGRVVP